MSLALILISFLYAVPIGRNALFVLVCFGFRPDSSQAHGLWNRLGYALACWEYFLYPFRHYLIGIPVTVYTAFSIVMAINAPNHSPDLLWWLVIVFFVWQTRRHRQVTDVQLTEFVYQWPHLHPADFFYLYKMELAFGLKIHTSCKEPRVVSGEHISFCDHKRPHFKFWALLECFFDTAYMAHMGMNLVRVVSKSYAFRAFDVLAVIWAKRILQLIENDFHMVGFDRLKQLKGKNLLVLNHKSSLDFILTYLAFSQSQIFSSLMRPRFLIAKDHFKDNPILYRFLGMGLLAEAVGMVFVSRKKRSQGFADLQYAAKQFLQSNIDLAVFPQGTRVEATHDRAGKRRDAGYYTTVRSVENLSKTAHLRKGTAYLIWDILSHMSPNECLNVIFIGVKGAGVALPKGSWKFQTDNDIVFEVGDVVTLTPQEVFADQDPGFSENEAKSYKKSVIEGMHNMIHEHLKAVLQIHDVLKQRYLTELKGQFRLEEHKIEQVSACMDEVSEQEDMVYQILDAIYSLPRGHWDGYLSQLTQLLLEKVSMERFELLAKEVFGDLLAWRKK